MSSASSSTNSVSASAYGMQPQTVAPPPPGSNGSIYSSGAAISKNNADMQNKAKFGGSRRSFKGGAASIVVPPVQVPYKEVGAGNNTTSANITNSTKAQADIYANKQYDACVGSTNPSCGMSGGKVNHSKGRSHKGGWPHWGCMSGGKKRSNKRRTNKRTTKRSCKKRKTRRNKSKCRR